MKGKLILASASPRRRELLQQIGLEFEVLTSDAPEITSETEPAEIVKDLSRQKAMAVKEQWEKTKSPSDVVRKNTLILGADTVVCHNGRILGKPKDEEEAFFMLRDLADATHKVYTGVTLLGESLCHSFSACTRVEVYPMTDAEILAYIATGDPMDKAGSYGIQGPFAAFVKGIRGDYNNVVGLPVSLVYQELKNLGQL